MTHANRLTDMPHRTHRTDQTDQEQPNRKRGTALKPFTVRQMRAEELLVHGCLLADGEDSMADADIRRQSLRLRRHVFAPALALWIELVRHQPLDRILREMDRCRIGLPSKGKARAEDRRDRDGDDDADRGRGASRHVWGDPAFPDRGEWIKLTGVLLHNDLAMRDAFILAVLTHLPADKLLANCLDPMEREQARDVADTFGRALYESNCRFTDYLQPAIDQLIVLQELLPAPWNSQPSAILALIFWWQHEADQALGACELALSQCSENGLARLVCEAVGSHVFPQA